MTPLVDIDAAKSDPGAQVEAAIGVFDPACFPPEMLHAASAIASEWRRVVDAATTSTERRRR
jgi:hypothetical protein